VLTPQFPAGHSGDRYARGQHRDAGRSSSCVESGRKLVVVVVFDAPAHRAKGSRRSSTPTSKRFGQHEVFLRVEQAGLRRPLIGAGSPRREGTLDFATVCHL
jgi:hypothetical protein